MRVIIFFLMLCFANNTFAQSQLSPFYGEDAQLWGFVNEKGAAVIPFKYTLAYNFSEGKAIVVVCNEAETEVFGGEVFLPEGCQMLVINHQNEVLFEIPDSLFFRRQYTIGYSSTEFRDGLLKVRHKESGKAGFINNNGALVIPCIYDKAGNFSEGLAYVANLTNTFMEFIGNNEIGYIDSGNNWKIRLDEKLANLENGCYFSGSPFRNGQANMTILENDGDCVNSGDLTIDNRGRIIEENWK